MDEIIETPEEIIPEPDPYHVYVQTDEQGRITAVNSSAFVSADWGTEIDQGYGYKYHHAQGNYFPQPIYTEDGISRYKLKDGAAMERTEEEIEADREGSISNLPYTPKQVDIENLILFQAQSLPDSYAVKVPSLYKPWGVGKAYGGEGQENIVSYSVGLVVDFPELYRCVQPHTSQADWTPPKTPALWVRIQTEYPGTIDNPIPAVRSMEYEYGKYYSDPEDGKIYLCKRIGEPEGGTIVLHYLPHELIGHYFEEAV